MSTGTAVITGVGVVSAFGVGADRFFAGLAAGRAAVGPIRSFDVSRFPVRVAGEVPEVVPVSPAPGAVRDRKVVFGLLAAEEAWAAAGCGPSERAASLVVAVGLEQAFLEDFAPLLRDGRIDWTREAHAATPPDADAVSGGGSRYRASLDEAVATLASRLALRGPTVAHVSACAAGARAISHAAALIERGETDIVVTGGMDSMVNPLGLGGMARLGAPSPRQAHDACRPFDRRRDGLVVGEGAAMFVVEHEARARARGASALAGVVGWGSTQDGYRATTPRPDGRAAGRAMSRALERAQLPPSAIGYVNAHGTGTPLNDRAEAAAIRLALGPQAERVPVSSIKGAIGHLMAASGAVEIAACLLPFTRHLLPGTAHHQQPDPDCPLNIVGERPVPAAEVVFVLSNSFGFGGQNASVVLGRCRP